MPNQPTRSVTFGTLCVASFGRIVNLVATHPLAIHFIFTTQSYYDYTNISN